MEEIYRNIKGYEGMYQVSNLGNVKSLDKLDALGRRVKGRVLKAGKGVNGYLTVALTKNSIQKTYSVHKLVAQAFLNHTPDGTQTLVVNHKDFNRTNNKVNNLEIVTQRTNSNRKHIKSTSKYTGVCRNKRGNRWQSRIHIGNKQVHLGYFTDEKLASDCYEIALIYHEQGITPQEIKRIIKTNVARLRAA